jgi:hypothetical protein
MVWCPNEIPEVTIPSYFPGDDAVDWVGVNFYSVIFNDGDRARGASWRNPADALSYVYKTYSAKHPMMVGEWAATHKSVVDHVDHSEFAVDKIGQFYAALPRVYPRVKAVHWLSMNTEIYADGPRKLNDFSLLDSPEVADAYSKAIAPSYFLSQATPPAPTDSDAPQKIVALSSGTLFKGTVALSAYVRSYDQRPHVTYILGGTRSYDADVLPGAYGIDVDTRDFANGPLQVVVQVRDSRGRLVGRQAVTVTVRN